MVAVDAVLVAAVALLVGGVIASLLPLVPGAALSLAGIYLYWWHTGYAAPGVAFVAVATVVGLVALVLDYLSSVISARLGGASLRTALAAGAVGLVALAVTGPIGGILGAALTVFALEFRSSRDLEGSLRSSLYTTLGMLTSTGVQLLLTLFLLIGFLVSVA